jgi:hypothetical protein
MIWKIIRFFSTRFGCFFVGVNTMSEHTSEQIHREVFHAFLSAGRGDMTEVQASLIRILDMLERPEIWRRMPCELVQGCFKCYSKRRDNGCRMYEVTWLDARKTFATLCFPWLFGVDAGTVLPDSQETGNATVWLETEVSRHKGDMVPIGGKSVWCLFEGIHFVFNAKRKDALLPQLWWTTWSRIRATWNGFGIQAIGNPYAPITTTWKQPGKTAASATSRGGRGGQFLAESAAGPGGRSRMHELRFSS